jgi:hypothetical protein
MDIRIAALAPKGLLAPVIDVAADLPGVVIVPCGYDDPCEVEILLTGVAGSVDGYMFNGPLPARRAASVLPSQVLTATVRYDAAAAANCLLRIYREIPEAMDRGVSLDSLGIRELDEMTAELSLDPNGFRRYDMRNPWDVESVAGHHRSLLRNHHVAAAAVGMRAAYLQLQAEGLPVFDVRPTKAAIRDALTELTVRILHAPALVDRIAVFFVDLADPPPSNPSSAWRVVARYFGRLLADRNVADYRISERLLVVTGGASRLNSIVGPNGQLHLRVQRATGLKVRVGYGEAETVPEAKRRAGLALDAVRQAGTFAVTSYHDAKVADEPQDGGTVAARPAAAHDPNSAVKNAILQAREVRRQLGASQVTAAGVANVLGVTRRSGRRLLLTWSDCGVAQVVATRRTGFAGRPEQVYEIRV